LAKASDRRKPRKAIQGFTPKKRAQFLAALALGMTVMEAAKKVGLSRRAAYSLRDRDKEFAAEWDAAYEESTERLEAECFQRAIGKEKAKLTKDGELVYVEEHSDLLLMFLLKARKPKMYREQVDINVKEERRILIDLLPVERGEDGRLRLADDSVTPLLGPGEEEG